MLFIEVGALLVLSGVLFLAVQAIRHGALSSAKGRRTSTEGDTLEPAQQGGLLVLTGNWPAYGLIVLGVILLLAGASF